MTIKTDAERVSARERLLRAADALFYEEGVHSVGVDRVIERAGVAKASLYNTFGSKDELIRAYLTARLDARKERVRRGIAVYDTPRERILGVFDTLGEVFADPAYRGCAFQNASAEIGAPGVRAVCDESRVWVRGLFTELATEAGATDPTGLAERLVLLYDGASTGAKMDRSAASAATAREVAAFLLDAAGAA
jgi:AcrR family transcriptional regulator